jgi:D-amino peptidase
MTPLYKSILILSDIEGSSGCWNRLASAHKTDEWARACVDMSLDVNALVTALFEAGVETIRVKDFHRTGYNLIPGLIDKRAEIIHGYKAAPVPGIGEPGNAEGVMMIGMHASSGSKGFISHTLTSRIKRIECNGRLLSEAELFSMVMAPRGIRPLLFSGCPISCKEVQEIMPATITYPIDKSIHISAFSKTAWREGLQNVAIIAIQNQYTIPYIRKGPFTTIVTMRQGPGEAKKIAKRWHFKSQEDRIILDSPDPYTLVHDLLRIAYLTPLIEKILPLGLLLFHLYGKTGQKWMYSRLKILGIDV